MGLAMVSIPVNLCDCALHRIDIGPETRMRGLL